MKELDDRSFVNKNKKHIKDLGGEVWSIEKLSMKEERYQVKYDLGGAIKNAVVKFNLLYEEEWK